MAAKPPYGHWQQGWLYAPGVQHCPSPNFNARPATATIDTVVVHCISLPERNHSLEHPKALFLNQLDPLAHSSFVELRGVEVSAHFLIGRAGEVLQFVSCDQRAWHAGVSAGMGRTGFNDFSVGIELVGDMFSPFAPQQYSALTTLLGELQQNYAMHWACAHSEIAPTRKTDPGPFFDWDLIRKPNTYALRPF